MSLLKAKNQYIERFLSMQFLGSWETSSRLSNSDITTSMAADNCWYLTNQLILTIDPDPDETSPDKFVAQTGDLYLTTFWRKNSYSGGLDFDNFLREESRLTLPTQQNSKLIFQISNATVTALKSRLAGRGITSEFGIAILKLQFERPDSSRYTRYFSVKVTHNAVFSSVPFVSPTPTVIDNEYTTPVYSFESLFIPTLRAAFVYNFYETQEENFDIASRRSFVGKPTTEIPKYIALSWTKAPVPETSRTEPPREFVTIDGISYTLTSGSLIDFFVHGLGDSSSEESSSPRTSTSVSLTSSFFETGFEQSYMYTNPFVTSIPEPSLLSNLFIVTDYAGYVIQKERYDQLNEAFVPIDLIVITDRNTTKYIDWKIAYGETYRYKIRSIFRFVNSEGLSMYKDSDELFDINLRSDRFETGVRTAETYYFDSKFSNDVEIDAIENTRPSCPQNVKIFPNSFKRHIFITWSQRNINNDVVGYNVYAKEKNSKLFQKLNSELLDIRNNYFVDYSVDFDQEKIYAVESFDIHGNFSTLSAQYQAKIIEQNIEVGRNEADVKLVEYEGKELFVDEIKLSNSRKDNRHFFSDGFILRINPQFKNEHGDQHILFKIKSLDSAAEKEIKINFDMQTIYHRSR